MLERFLYFKKEINIVLNKANKLNSSKKKDLNLDNLSFKDEEWDYLKKIIDILEFFRKPTIMLQGSTSNVYTIIYIIQLYNKYIGIKDIIEDSFLKEGLNQAINKLLYYFPINSTNISSIKDLYIITILDPRFKLEIFYNLDLNIDIIDNIKSYFIEIYNIYKEKITIVETSNTIESSFSSNLDLVDINYNSDDDLYIRPSTTTSNISNEIELYLSEPRTTKDISIDTYYNTNKNRFPIIYNIARDYLAILATSTPSKATFSKVGNIVTKSRNRLLASSIKKLIILKELGVIEDKEELINNNLLFNKDLNITSTISSKAKGKQKQVIDIEDDNNLEEKSTTSITSYNSNNTNNRSSSNSNIED